MDPSSSEALRVRLEQQRHWLAAEAVENGRQPRVDPDVAALQKSSDTERLYDDEYGAFAKQLINGEWTRVEMADRLNRERTPAHAGTFH